MEQARKTRRGNWQGRVITDRAKVKELRAAGKSLPATAREMDWSVTTVARICKDAAHRSRLKASVRNNDPLLGRG
jgi:hypothetical protein